MFNLFNRDKNDEDARMQEIVEGLDTPLANWEKLELAKMNIDLVSTNSYIIEKHVPLKDIKAFIRRNLTVISESSEKLLKDGEE